MDNFYKIDDLVTIEQTLIKNEEFIKVMSNATKPILISSDSKFNEAVNPIIRLYAKQLKILSSCDKTKCFNLYQKYPDLRHWLQLFRINTNTIDKMCNKNKCFYELFENYKESLKIDLKNIDENDYKTICDSFDKLKASYDSLPTNALDSTNIQQINTVSCNNLFIRQDDDKDYQLKSPYKPKHQRKSESDIINQTLVLNNNNNQLNNDLIKQIIINKNEINNASSPIKYPVSSPTFAKFYHPSNKSNGNNKIKNSTNISTNLQSKVTTPPPSRKNSTLNNNNSAIVNETYVLPANMQKSPSYETNSKLRVDIPTNDLKNHKFKENYLIVDRRPSIDGISEYSNNSKSPSGQVSPLNPTSPSKSTLNNNIFIPSQNPQINIIYGEHCWSSQFKLSKSECCVCNKKINFSFRLKCRYCKITCHKDCEKKIPTKCYGNQNSSSSFSNLTHNNSDGYSQNKRLAPSNHSLNKINQESSSNASSCNSSTPNSPNIIINNDNQAQFMNFNRKYNSQSSNSNLTTPNSNVFSADSKTQFFPSTLQIKPRIDHEYDDDDDDENYQQNNESDQSYKKIDKDDNSHDLSALNNSFKSDSLDIDSANQASLSYQAFNIKYEEIQFKNEIGRGRFGKVFKAHWHGSHAVKVIDFDENITEASDQFKYFTEEVLNLCKTRHTNLILFVGACMKPPKLAVVMSLCRGITLHKYLYMDNYSNKPSSDDIILICIQIAQGMGYLHAKNLLHKDLRSKNIFIEGNKVIISDFGLYSLNRLCNRIKRKNLLMITKECLCYMAPELIRCIGLENVIDMPFSQASDVFAFGTICYELFCFEFPYISYDSDTIIFLIGNGYKNISPNIQIAKELKNILLKCWSKDPNIRPNFYTILEQLRALPKRKLHRSPSHPTQIGRSLQALNVNDT